MTRFCIYHANLVTPSEIIKDATLWIENGQILRLDKHTTAITSGEPSVDAKHAWVLPAFIDLHIHGMGGYGPEQSTPDALLQMSRVLARQGVGAFCPTLYCANPTHLATQITALLPAFGKETGARLLGFHLEGPFLSPAQTGVMKPTDLAPAQVDILRKLYQTANGKIAILTLAPELPGIDAILDFCAQHKIVVQAGHTDATYAQMQAAVEKGVRRVTHVGNAMRGFHHREPGALGAALFDSRISCEVIADAKHTHPAFLSFLRQVKPLEQITAVTDALMPTGQVSGPFIANGEEVVQQDGVWKRKQDGVIAGSALTMLEAFKQLIACGYSMQEASACTSTNPAKCLYLKEGLLAPHAPANLVFLSKDLQLQSVYLNGKKIN